MIGTALFALNLLTSAQAPTYQPTGPRIRFSLEGGRSFVIATDPKASPKTVAHIRQLAERGFYNGQRIHRSEDWVVQFGAPASRTEPLDVRNSRTGQKETNPRVANGGSGLTLPFEGSDVDFRRGVVGIASTGLQVGGDSQLFILRKDWERLWRSYAVVGKVVEGMAVVDAMRRGDRIVRAEVVDAPTRKLSGTRATRA